MKQILIYLCIAGCFSSCAQTAGDSLALDSIQKDSSFNLDTIKTTIMNNEDWKEKLTEEEYYVLRQKGTERPHTSKYNSLWDSGTYVCKGCGAELFSSATKFDAHCGWPSFYEAANKENVEEVLDKSHGMIRTEVVCKKCKGHLGHVFNDGPQDKTGLRYCINGVSLGFKPKEE